MLPLWLATGLGLELGLGLRWSLCLGMGCCTNFGLGFGFALRFGAALTCVLGFDFGFGSGFAPCAAALELLSCKRRTRDQWNNFTTDSSVILQCMIRGDFTATIAPLLPPSTFFCKHALFFQTRNGCNLCRHDRAATVWATLTCNCPLTGQSWDNPNQDA